MASGCQTILLNEDVMMMTIADERVGVQVKL